MGIEVVLVATIARAAPLALAAMGGYASERSGVINIGLEGKMLAAACVMAVVGARTGNAGAGLAAAILAAVLLSLLHWLMTQTYRVDHVISGMAINAVAFGGVNYAAGTFLEPGSTIPRLSENVFYAAAVLIPIGLAWGARSTRAGLRFLAVGSDPDKARLLGLRPGTVRAWALCVTGLCTGLSGAMILNGVGNLTDTMTAGRGFIALAALILGSWRPLPALLACLLFGFLEALQLVLQGTSMGGVRIPSEVWNALPYLATLLALGGLMGRTKAPAGLGKP